jgi:hypothetical protein
MVMMGDDNNNNNNNDDDDDYQRIQQTINTQKSPASSLTITCLSLPNDGDCHVP